MSNVSNPNTAGNTRNIARPESPYKSPMRAGVPTERRDPAFPNADSGRKNPNYVSPTYKSHLFEPDHPDPNPTSTYRATMSPVRSMNASSTSFRQSLNAENVSPSRANLRSEVTPTRTRGEVTPTRTSTQDRAANNNGGSATANPVVEQSGGSFFANNEPRAFDQSIQASAAQPQSSNQSSGRKEAGPLSASAAGLAGSPWRQSSPQRTRRYQARPDDTGIFEKTDFSPRRKDLQEIVFHKKEEVLSSAEPPKGINLNDYNVDMNRANKTLQDIRKSTDKIAKDFERKLEQDQIQEIREKEEERSRLRALERERLRHEYEVVAYETERKRVAAIDAKKPTSQDIEGSAQRRERQIEEQNNAARNIAEARDHYRQDLNQHIEANQTNRRLERELDRDLERSSVGLPVGNYNWDYKREVAETLGHQVDEKRQRQDEERRQDIDYGRRTQELTKKLEDKQRDTFQEYERIKRQQYERVKEELDRLERKRQEEKQHQADVSRREREEIAEINYRIRQEELQRKADIRDDLSNVYDYQMEEARAKKQLERTDGVEVSRLTKSPLRSSGKIYSPSKSPLRGTPGRSQMLFRLASRVDDFPEKFTSVIKYSLLSCQ
eukprot:TRINITY_DN891_c0_g2_i1.p1 TRINITY_DN891_c0_g2~~TRINITY_DN891_c0_g2_i1.p1  ORF type:complete len:609 (-),score=189.11 TRINITY_DN891_c0_g2_i1:123-1949(-)